MRSARFLIPVAAGIAGAVTIGLSASAATPQRSPQSVFRSGIDLVTLWATVTDAQGRLMADLTKEDFQIYEDGVLQTVTHFTRERVPVGLGILLDVSDSMQGQPVTDARAALDRFVIDLLDEGDEAFLIAFNHAIRFLVPWTAPPRLLGHRLDGVKPLGSTALYDALAESLPLFERRQRPRAAAVLISDGADTASAATPQSLWPLLQRTDAFVYAIALDPTERRFAINRVDTSALQEITARSGGYTEVIHVSEDLPAATARIADELNHQYTLAYAPVRPFDGTYRSIRIRIAGEDYRVRARRGYVATPRSRAGLSSPW